MVGTVLSWSGELVVNCYRFVTMMVKWPRKLPDEPSECLYTIVICDPSDIPFLVKDFHTMFYYINANF